jgi:hypothetical protein
MRRAALRAVADFPTAKEIGRGRFAARPFLPNSCVLRAVVPAVCRLQVVDHAKPAPTSIRRSLP